MRTRLLVVPAVVAVAALFLTGCVNNEDTGSKGSGGGSTNAGSVKKDDALAGQLPDKVKKAGKLVVGMDPTYAPNEFKDSNGNVTGWEVELTNAIGQTLGVKIDYAVAKFDNIIPSITGGRYDMGMSSFTDNTEREKQVDFVNYYTAGITWAEPAGKTVDPNNACGLKVGVQSTTVEDTDEVPAKSKKCTDEGKPAIQKFQYDAQDSATNALILGQIDAMSADSPVTAYAIKQSKGKLKAAGETFDVAPYGIPVAKGSKLGPLLQKTMQKLMDDGTYGKILAKWGVDGGAVKTAGLNQASKG